MSLLIIHSKLSKNLIKKSKSINGTLARRKSFVRTPRQPCWLYQILIFWKFQKIIKSITQTALHIRPTLVELAKLPSSWILLPICLDFQKLVFLTSLPLLQGSIHKALISYQSTVVLLLNLSFLIQISLRKSVEKTQFSNYDCLLCRAYLIDDGKY